MLGNILGFGRMHENKTFFFVFLKEEINLKYLRFFLKKKFRNFLEETRYFNTGSVSYSVSI
jgi:hypothetical protein